MKKILLGALCVLLQFPLLAEAQSAHPLVKENNLVIPALNSKTIFRELYADKMVGISFYAEDSDKDDPRLALPYVRVRKGKADDQLAVLYPVQKYKNQNGEVRYLVEVERVDIVDDSIQFCTACSSDIDFYIFAPVGNKFKLLSSTEAQSDIPGSHGQSDFNTTNNDGSRKVWKPTRVGLNKMGILYTGGGTYQGTFIDNLNLLVLNENKPIKNYGITSSPDFLVEDNSAYFDGDSPLAYSYKGEYSLMPDQSSELYPIKIQFKGEKPNQQNKIRPYNVTKVYRFNPAKNKFIAK